MSISVRSHFAIRVLMVFVFIVAGFAAVLAQPAAADKKNDPLKNFQYRLIGPFRGGRVAAVPGLASQPNVYYFGASWGGVWKSTDRSMNWENITVGYFKTSSLRAIAVTDA